MTYVRPEIGQDWKDGSSGAVGTIEDFEDDHVIVRLRDGGRLARIQRDTFLTIWNPDVIHFSESSPVVVTACGETSAVAATTTKDWWSVTCRPCLDVGGRTNHRARGRILQLDEKKVAESGGKISN